MCVTAILLNYKRPYHLPRIIESLAKHEFLTQAVIWNNGESLIDVLPETMLNLTVIDSPENICTFGRYRAAEYAENDVLYFQDDDCVIHRVPELYKRWLTHQDKITAGLKPRHFAMEANKTRYLQLGWGSFHKIEWLDCILPYMERWGVDETLIRKFDRLYSALFGRHDPVLLEEGREIELLKSPNGGDSDRDANALWLRRDHLALTRQAMARVKELGAVRV